MMPHMENNRKRVHTRWEQGGSRERRRLRAREEQPCR